MLKVKTKKVIEAQDWDELVEKHYGRPYAFQQQGGCQERGVHHLTVPSDEVEDYENDTVPEEVNNEEVMGVSFTAWLARDPKQKLSNPDDQADYCIRMWYERNFYPSIEMIANDLHKKGLLEAGDYIINIDW